MTDVVFGKEVPDKGVTAPPPLELVEAGGRSVARRIIRVTAPPPLELVAELVEAVGRIVAGRIVEAGGDIFRVILIVFRVEA